MVKKIKSSGSSWQSQKSSLTRDRIIISTLECIVEYGYVQTTMVKIASQAGVSQGSMQYHFPAKIDAIKAAINYLHVKRLSDHQKDLADIPEGVDPMDHAIEVYWKHLTEGHFVAYQDLVIAARTDPELAGVLKPAYQRFISAWRKDALNLVPEWSDARKRIDLIFDIGQYQMEGLAFGLLNDQLNPERVRAVLEFTKQQLIGMLKEMEQ